jgi:hypothetical protein
MSSAVLDNVGRCRSRGIKLCNDDVDGCLWGTFTRGLLALGLKRRRSHGLSLVCGSVTLVVLGIRTSRLYIGAPSSPFK